MLSRLPGDARLLQQPGGHPPNHRQRRLAPQRRSRGMDEQGYVRVTGRLKDMICRGGEKIFPREVEEFLFTHPRIAEAYVIGVPDPYYGEQVMAWVKLKTGQVMA